MFQSITSLLPMLTRIAVILIIFLLFDLYAFQSVRSLSAHLNTMPKRSIRIIYWGVSVLFYLLFIFTITGKMADANKTFRTFTTGLFFALVLSKILMILPLLAEDIYRIFNKFYELIFVKPQTQNLEGEKSQFLVSRKKFISQISTGIGLATFSGLTYGVIKGAHNYKLHQKNVVLKNLPPNFNGLKIGHISDIHSGSFWDKNAVQKGVDLLMSQKPDIVFFTGDLVNDVATEMDNYKAIFSQIKAPLGVYSSLGNHDYGDYYQWPDKHEINFDVNFQGNKSHMTPMQKANLEALKQVHADMGWRLLMNEHVPIEVNGEKIAVLGIENYGAKGRFPRYGKMTEAHTNTEQYPVKLLLSHDPSHWEAEVIKKYKDVDIMFAGHTHGAQFGIETAGFKWSPIKYIYKQWAGLYQQDNQYLYVNRGFGYLGYPGRLGIRPEITMLTINNA